MKTIYQITWIIALLLIAGSANAQSEYRILKDKSSIEITGTSSLHDWEMKAEQVNGSAEVNLENSVINDITGGTVTLKVSDITSHSNIMDSKARDALKGDKYPEIVFTITSVKLQPSTGSIRGIITGKLRIAGVTKEVSTAFTGNLTDGSQLAIKGKMDLDMQAYHIDPPTAMMGTLKTGSMVELNYNILMQRTAVFSQNNH